MVEIPEGYVLVPKDVYELLVNAATPPRIMLDPSNVRLNPAIGDPQVTCGAT